MYMYMYMYTCIHIHVIDKIVAQREWEIWRNYDRSQIIGGLPFRNRRFCFFTIRGLNVLLFLFGSLILFRGRNWFRRLIVAMLDLVSVHTLTAGLGCTRLLCGRTTSPSRAVSGAIAHLVSRLIGQMTKSIIRERSIWRNCDSSQIEIGSIENHLGFEGEQTVVVDHWKQDV